MSKSQKEAAVEALEFNKGLNEVFVTEDSKPFLTENAAVNYSVKHKIDVEKVKGFDRSIVEPEEEEDFTLEELKEMASELQYEDVENATEEELRAFVKNQMD